MAVQIASKFLSWLSGGSDRRVEGALLTHVLQNSKKGNPESVLSAIDNYAKRNKLQKHLAEEQSSILDAELKKDILDAEGRKVKRIVALELGTYCGYSAIRIATNMANSDINLISLENDIFNYGVAEKMIQYAGISSNVTLLKGPLNDDVARKVDQFLNQIPTANFNFIFINDKCYLTHFMFLKDRGMLGKGTVIVANSKGFSQHPEYLQDLNEHPKELESNARGSAVKSMTVYTYK